MAQPLRHSRAQVVEKRPPSRLWISRGLLLVAMVLLPLIGVLVYVGPALANVLWRLTADGGVCLLWLAGALGIGGAILKLTNFWHGTVVAEVPTGQTPQPLALGFATAAALGLGILSLATLALGLAGVLNVFTAWAMLVIGWVLGGWTVSRTTSADILNWLKEPAGWAWLWLLATPFLMLALTAAMTPPGMLWTPREPHGYDVVEYHLQVPREWYEVRRIVPLHHNVFSFFPFNVEMHYLLAMHLRGGPWAGMYLAQLMHLTFFVLLVVAVYGLARRFARPASATIAALCLLTVPWITQLAGIAYDEGGFLLFGILAIGFAIIATFESPGRLKRFALAGAMAGFAAGSKLTAVPEVLVAVPIVSVLAAFWLSFSGSSEESPARQDTGGPPVPRREAGATLWIGIVLFGFVGLLCFSPWMIRNIVWARNPVFPEMMHLLGSDDFTAVQVERFEKAHQPPPAQQPLSVRVQTLNREVLGWWPDFQSSGESSAWQFGYLIFPLALIAFGLSIRRPQSWCLVGLLLILALFWLLMTHLQSRFFILAAPISAILIAQIEWKRAAPAGAAIIAIFAGLGFVRVADRLNAKLYGSDANSTGIVSVLGADGGWLYQQMLPGDLPKSGAIFLIGNARAFLYPIPMSRLRYRTVFDVKDDGETIVKAWTGPQPPERGDCLLIDPAELRRFSQTYYGLPPVPAYVERAEGPIIQTVAK